MCYGVFAVSMVPVSYNEIMLKFINQLMNGILKSSFWFFGFMRYIEIILSNVQKVYWNYPAESPRYTETSKYRGILKLFYVFGYSYIEKQLWCILEFPVAARFARISHRKYTPALRAGNCLIYFRPCFAQTGILKISGSLRSPSWSHPKWSFSFPCP